jgi:hypothetical protein
MVLPLITSVTLGFSGPLFFAAVRQGRGLGYLLDFSSMIEASWGILSEGQISIAWG